MTLCYAFKSALKCAFILLTVGLLNDGPLTRLAAAQMQATPLWDTRNNGEQFCFVTNNRNESDEKIQFQGSAHSTCSLQVAAMQELSTVIEIPNINGSEKVFLYIKLVGELKGCLSTFVMINGETEACSIVLTHPSFHVILQGNINILISGTKETEFHPRIGCPDLEEVRFHPEMSQASNCSHVQEFIDGITCAIHNDHIYWEEMKYIPGLCSLDFPSNCNARVGNRRVVFHHCSDTGLIQNQEILIIYPVDIAVLDLTENKITELDVDAFQGLNTLQSVYLMNNQLTNLEVGVFEDLNRLSLLAVNDNDLPALSIGLFQNLDKLTHLYLYGNELVTLNASVFSSLQRLTFLSLFNNKLSVLPFGVFKGLRSLNELYLSDNLLTTLDIGVLQNLRKLTHLGLDRNKFHKLQVGLLEGLENLSELFLSKNQLAVLDSGLFDGLGKLTRLALDNNQLGKLPGDIFRGLKNLLELYLYENQFVSLPDGLFKGLSNLKVLFLRDNHLIELGYGFFVGLHNLEALFLDNNQIARLSNDAFHDLNNLKLLNFNNNQLRELNQNVFKFSTNITIIDLSTNWLEEIPDIKNLNYLNMLNLRGNALSRIGSEHFSSLRRNTELYVSQHEICECFVPAYVNCSAANDRSPYLTCDRLLSDRVLEIIMWFIGLNALGGNIFVLSWRRKILQKNKIQTLLLSNLAMSDLLMGIYMLIIASADVYFGEHFPMQSETWRSGITCRIAGAISITSSEASVFFVTLISVDRFVCIRFPHSKAPSSKRARFIVLLTWIVSLALGVVPSSLAGENFKFYDNSHVCIGLPLALNKMYTITKSSETIYEKDAGFFYVRNKFTTHFKGFITGKYFSTVVFLGLNFICYLIILGCYVEIIRVVYRSSKRVGLNREMKEQFRMTAKVAAIVVTDFSCWFPIILLGILVQARILTLPPSVFAWCVTFVMPINSAINPYLYTISAIISNRHKQQCNTGSTLHQKSSRRQGNSAQPLDTRPQTVSTTAPQQSVLAAGTSGMNHPHVPMHAEVAETDV